MHIKTYHVSILLLFVIFIGCKKVNSGKSQKKFNAENQIEYAKGFSINEYAGFTILKVSNPWPNANKTYTYVMRKKRFKIPDSLAQNIIIDIPIKSIVVTSTTHLPSLEMLGVEKTLVGFPNLDYISSEKIRARIDAKKITELGNNQDLNIEKTIELSPAVFIGYGIDNSNKTLDNLAKSGQKILINGDWNEETPLGKAEWIKFFGVLYGKEKLAKSIFDKIATDYKNTVAIAKKATLQPTVLSGAMFQDVWYLPKGNSWGSIILADANANYLWKDVVGTGSLNLNFETVFERAQNADFWIQGQFSSTTEIEKANKHYKKFKAFQSKNVYSFASKKGKTGGVLFYELAPNRPDLLLKDMVKILHPELLVGYKPFFVEKLK
jgi:iron complex transport system substrate-binding protein